MNKQNPPNAIEWTRIINADGTVRPGYTWNPVGGCKHACRWEMPDGKIAVCYAETVAERVAQASYPEGFSAHYWHPERLKEPGRVKEPAGIFLDSMADLMGHWVPQEQIEQVLQVCRDNPQHIFITLTKNAPRLLDFTFPDNVWVLVSSPPDFFMGKRLSAEQQTKMLVRSLNILVELKYLRKQAKVIGLSAEPLSWPISELVKGSMLDWCIIGAASNGRDIHQPEKRWVDELHTVCDDEYTAVFHKGNIRPIVDQVRAKFPYVENPNETAAERYIRLNDDGYGAHQS